jgi:hypothetical protein
MSIAEEVTKLEAASKLTKRELFALVIMHAYSTHPDTLRSHETNSSALADLAVLRADALIEELEGG